MAQTARKEFVVVGDHTPEPTNIVEEVFGPRVSEYDAYAAFTTKIYGPQFG